MAGSHTHTHTPARTRPPTRTQAARLTQVTLTALALGSVIWFFHWTVRTSGGFGTPGEEDYYNFLVRGWRSGHLYMSKEPRPEMLALADPYDPAQNAAVRMGDASYFRGRYYLYFGAAPAALVMMPYHVLTGKELGTTTVIFGFCATGFLACSVLWLAVRRRYFRESALWVAPGGVLMLGLSTHLLVLLRRPLVWELPISTCYAMTMLALLAVYAALHGRRPIIALGLAGISLGLAAGARPTYVFSTVMLLPALWGIRRARGRIWRRAGLAAAAGFGVCVLVILAHNYARFGNPLEFGQNYQLSGIYESKADHFRAAYLPRNLFIYFSQSVRWSPELPFMFAEALKTEGAVGYHGRFNEGVAGLLVTFPFIGLAPAFLLAVRGRQTEALPPLRAMIGAVVFFFLTMLAVVGSYFLATPRYAADFAPALALMAAFGWLGLERWARESGWHKVTTPVIALICLATAVAAVLVSLEYHGRLLRLLQPQLWADMEGFFNSLGR